MNIDIFAAFIIGLAGSLHCIGMCGPIILILPTRDGSRLNYFTGRLLYNFGRTISYSALGILSGFIGHSFVWSGSQRTLSILMGVVIILFVIIPTNWKSSAIDKIVPAKLTGLFKSFWGRLFRRSSLKSLWGIGLLNGFLPCGLVYIALAGAAATGDPLKGGLYMALFGLGTFPVMLTGSLLGSLVGIRAKKIFRPILPIGAIIIAILLILRGMSLGIPLISPAYASDQKGEVTVQCCPAKTADTTAIDSIAGPKVDK